MASHLLWIFGGSQHSRQYCTTGPDAYTPEMHQSPVSWIQLQQNYMCDFSRNPHICSVVNLHKQMTMKLFQEISYARSVFNCMKNGARAS